MDDVRERGVMENLFVLPLGGEETVRENVLVDNEDVPSRVQNSNEERSRETSTAPEAASNELIVEEDNVFDNCKEVNRSLAREDLNLERQALEAYRVATSPSEQLGESFEFDFVYQAKRSNQRSTPLGQIREDSGRGQQHVGKGKIEHVQNGQSKALPTPVHTTSPLSNASIDTGICSTTPSFKPITPPIIFDHNSPKRNTKKFQYKSFLADDRDCQVVVICGSAGTGKNALSETLIANSPSVFTKIVQHTTRSPLKHEMDGRDFHFVSMEVAGRMITNGEMAEFVLLQPEVKKTKYNAAWLERKKHISDEDGHVGSDTLSGTPSLPRSPMYSHMEHPAAEGQEVLYGTSFQCISEAKNKGLPCAVLATSIEGAVQLYEQGLTGLFAYLQSGDEGLVPELDPMVVIDIGNEPYSVLLQHASNYVRTTVPHEVAVYRSVEAQWNSVPEMPMAFKQPGASQQKVSYTAFISFAQVLQHLQTIDMSEELKVIQPELHYSGLKAVSHKVFGPPKITGRSLIKERDLVFAIAQLKLESDDPIHNAALQTIFKKLTSGKETVDCPRFGPHWELIGFQGSDPRTDVRATGFLSILQLLYLVDTKDRLALATKVYSLSQSADNPFPFCVLAINITRIALSALREGYLTKECKREGAVIDVVNHFYVSTLYHYYNEFKRKKMTFKELGGILQNTEKFCKKHVRQCLHAYDEGLAEVNSGRHQPSGGQTRSSRETTPTCNEEVQFTDLAVAENF